MPSENGEQPLPGLAIVKAMRIANTHKRISTPVGELTLVAGRQGLAAILWEHESPGRVPLELGHEESSAPLLLQAEAQLMEYFAGRRRRFSLPLDPAGTLFQQQVWAALRTIPFGETRSYAQIACQIGRPAAARAVGAANGRNPLSIVTPCHRVVGASGALTGFAGGLKTKAFLLDWEARAAAAKQCRHEHPRQSFSSRWR